MWLAAWGGWGLVLAWTCTAAQPATNPFRVRCTVIMQTRPDRLYCYATNEPFRLLLREPGEFKHGEILDAEGPRVATNLTEVIPTLVDATVRRVGGLQLPAPLSVTAADLTNGTLNFRRVSMIGRVTSHEWMYFRNHHIEIVVAESGGHPFRVNVLDYSNAREKLPVGTQVEFVGLSFMEVFAEPRGPEVQLDLRNFDECRIVRPAPWLTLEMARRLLLTGAVLAGVVGIWFVRERYQIGRLRSAERTVRELNSELEARVAQRTGALQKSEAKFRALYEIASAAHGTEDLPALYARIHEAVRTVMRAENFFLLLHNPVTGLYDYAYHVDQMDARPEPRRVSSGLVGYVLRTGRALRVDRASMTDPRNAWCSVGGTPSAVWLGVPLRGRGQIIGVMAVQDYREAAAYGEAEEKVLTYMATQAAQAIEGKRAEAEMERALANERELSEMKSRFVSMVSHEFRTPLGIITSSAEILEAYLDRLSPDDRKRNLRDITEATQQMARMMEEVLLLGRVEAGKITCRPAPLDLGGFCAKLVDELVSATGGRCPIALRCRPDLGPATADEGLLRHILTNLLNNAVKYSPAGNPVEFTVDTCDSYAIFRVRDRGIGIPEADQRQLFQVFQRGHNVGETPGTGLGMVIVKHCVQLHGGRLAFESREGEGSTFTVALPLFGPPPAAGAESFTQFFRASKPGPNAIVVS